MKRSRDAGSCCKTLGQLTALTTDGRGRYVLLHTSQMQLQSVLSHKHWNCRANGADAAVGLTASRQGRTSFTIALHRPLNFENCCWSARSNLLRLDCLRCCHGLTEVTLSMPLLSFRCSHKPLALRGGHLGWSATPAASQRSGRSCQRSR
jgi:hypothetical protein